MIGTIEFYIALISSLAFFSWGAFGLWQLRRLRQKQRREMSDNQEPKPIASRLEKKRKENKNDRD